MMVGVGFGVLLCKALLGNGGSVLFSKDNVERIVATLGRMRGAALKLGQMISMQDGNLFPPEVEAIFARVRDTANFMPTSQMEIVLREELGESWREHFSEFEMIPFAAASIGQVHRAKLRDGGGMVAVKIQYPGISKSILSDLDNLRAILLFSQLLPKGLFLENSLRVAQRELEWECDYVREARYMRHFAELLKDEPGFVVPKVIQGLCTRRVLVCDYLPGTPINTLLTLLPQEGRDRICELIVELCIREIFEFRCMQTDPNWSNFLHEQQPNGRIVLLDFGSARDFSEAFVQDYAQVIQAAARQDREAVLRWSERLGFLTGDETAAMREAHLQAVMALGLPFAQTGPYDFGRATEEVTLRVRGLLPTMISHRLTPPPEESYSLHRKLSGVFLLCTRLAARVDCHSLLDRVLRRSMGRGAGRE